MRANDPPSDDEDLTLLLRRMSKGDSEAADAVASAVYRELKRLARSVISSEHRMPSLQPTILVNEAFMRLLKGRPVDWQDRQHFYLLAGRTMRRIVVDHFRGRTAAKRPTGHHQISLDNVVMMKHERREEAIIVDEALDRLAKLDPRAASVVEMRYFAGLTVEEIAVILNKDERTIKRDWKLAQSWLQNYLTQRGGKQPPADGMDGVLA